jgi:F-type H+-transporting ATPase subunit delta
MRDTTIARNYAEALLALAGKVDDLDGWGALIVAVADAVQSEPKLRNFLAAPQVSPGAKKAVIEKAFGAELPRNMVRFLQKLVDNRRQTLIPQIAIEYGNLVDQAEGRLHALVTVAREPAEHDQTLITQQLSKMFGKKVVPHISVNPSILGGLIVRVGDTVIDGSVRRRLAVLRGRLLERR